MQSFSTRLTFSQWKFNAEKKLSIGKIKFRGREKPFAVVSNTKREKTGRERLKSICASEWATSQQHLAAYIKKVIRFERVTEFDKKKK